MNNSLNYLDSLYLLISDRIRKKPVGSYVAKLVAQGEDSIIRKIGEEATEFIIAAKNKNKKEIITETADLLFNILFLLAYYKIPLTKVISELKKRRKSPSSRRSTTA